METWRQLKDIQPVVVRMLMNSLRKNRVAHAYLFDGDRGTGKKEASILLAKSIFCKNQETVEPCNECIECRRIESKNHPDVLFLSPEGQSLKKEQIVGLQKEFTKTGVESNQKVYIIEHADRMTTQAANSLLKFLEEPVSQTVAILLTEQVHRILPTILSRCQILSFQPLTPDSLIEKLIERGTSEYMAKTVAALTNSFQEAIPIIEDDWFAQARNIVIQLNEAIKERPEQSFLLIADKWMTHFKEKQQVDLGLDLILLWYKDLLYMRIGEPNKVIFSEKREQLEKYTLYASDLKVLDQITAVLEAKKRLNANTNPQLLMEQLVLKLQEG